MKKVQPELTKDVWNGYHREFFGRLRFLTPCQVKQERDFLNLAGDALTYMLLSLPNSKVLYVYYISLPYLTLYI